MAAGMAQHSILTSYNLLSLAVKRDQNVWMQHFELGLLNQSIC